MGRSAPFSATPQPQDAPAPATQLVGLLRAARAAGAPFGQAWRQALPQLTWHHYPTTAAQEKRAIVWAKPFFEHAYCYPEARPKWLQAILSATQTSDADDQTSFAA
jgi:hypothetical protein